MKNKTSKTVLVIILSFFTAASPANGERKDLKTYTETVVSSQQEYEISVSGDLEPENFELVIENTGSEDIIDPKITINGKWDWSNVESIVKEAVKDALTEEEKAMAIWQFVRDNRYHWQHSGDNHSDPLKYLNVYGYGFCGSTAYIMDIFAKVAGLRSRYWALSGHLINETYFNGAWHVLDGQTKAFYLKGDNKTIAGMEDLTKDPWLVERTVHPVADMWRRSHLRRARGKYSKERFRKTVANWYTSTGNNRMHQAEIDGFHSMGITLRPGEIIIFRFDNKGKYHNNFLYNEPPLYANGKIVYTPDFTSNNYRKGIECEKNIKSITDDGFGPNIHVDSCVTEVRRYRVKGDDAGYLVYKIESPYVIVGGEIGGSFYRNDNYGDMCRILVSFDGQDWIPVWTAGKTGEIMHFQDLDHIISPIGEKAKYKYFVKLQFRAAGGGLDPPQEPGDNTHSGINTLKMETDFQISPFSIPKLSLGLNRIKYSDKSQGERKVRITHRWCARYGSHYPQAPRKPIFPEDNGTIMTLAPGLKWEKGQDPDENDKIVDYHLQISRRPDCRWALCPNLDLDLKSDSNEFQLPQGWLNPGETYYWRVKARDSSGNWSAYSNIWKFKTSKMD